MPSRSQAPPALRVLRRLQSALTADRDVLRCVVGFGSGTELYALSLCAHPRVWSSFEALPAFSQLQKRWPTWAMRWDAASEFGQWDGLRLRTTTLGQ